MSEKWNEALEDKDFDEDIKKREALLEEAKNLEVSSDWNQVSRELSDLRKRWKRISYWESAYEDSLEEQFEAVIDVFYAKRNEIFQNSGALKQELIQKAKKLVDATNMNQATEQMNELMRQWKAAGSCGKDEDALWAEFNEARQAFYDVKRKFREERQERFENARKVKEELITQAAAVADSTDWQKTSELLRGLMVKWKAAESAGREHEERLWKEFNEACQQFYARREEHYKELHEVQKGNYDSKNELLEKARAVLEKKEFTKEATAYMKELGVKWKKIGSCGKEKEDRIWNEFRAVMDGYFNGLKEFNEQKHQQWLQRMQDNRNRKQDLIANQKRQIKRMQDDLISILSEREYENTQAQIEEKKAFVAELEEQLAELDKTINES